MPRSPRSIYEIITEILEKEGHTSHHPDDIGGNTTWGITELTARSCGYKGKMSELTQEIARDIYLKHYISKPRFDDIHAISNLVGEELIDTGINMGRSTSSKFLQCWLNVYNNKQALYLDVVVDGYIGKITINALKVFLKHRGFEGEQVLWTSLNCSQGARYLEISQAREKNESFIYGWMKNRVGV